MQRECDVTCWKQHLFGERGQMSVVYVLGSNSRHRAARYLRTAGSVCKHVQSAETVRAAGLKNPPGSFFRKMLD